MPPSASPMLGSPSSRTMDLRRARAASTGGGVMRSIPLRTQESEIAVERNGMPSAPTLPAMSAVTSAEVTRLARAPKMRSGALRAVAATLPRIARPIAAPAACPPTSSATAIGDADDGAPERLGDDAGDERDGEERDDAAGDDAGDRADAARESVAPALAEVHEEQQDQQHVEQSRGEHGRVGLRQLIVICGCGGFARACAVRAGCAAYDGTTQPAPTWPADRRHCCSGRSISVSGVAALRRPSASGTRPDGAGDGGTSRAGRRCRRRSGRSAATRRHGGHGTRTAVHCSRARRIRHPVPRVPCAGRR